MTDTITVDIPEWAKERNIYVFAGRELLASQEVLIIHQDGKHVPVRQPLMIKPEDGRCTGCGSCCTSTGISQKLLDEMKQCLENPLGEACPFLGKHGCIMKGWIPFSCAKSVCTAYEGCTEYMVEA